MKILVIDYIFYKELLKSFDKNIIDMLDIRLKELNLYVLFYLIFVVKEKLNFQNYLKTFILLSKCKIVITGNDN